MPDTIAIMFTMTTYGTWLRGDERGWVDQGRIIPPNPPLAEADRKRIKHPMFLFDTSQFLGVGQFIGDSLCERLELAIFAMTIQIWHIHFVVGATTHGVDSIAKCAKDAVRWGLRPGQPIWTKGYYKQFCFDIQSTINRIRYVERHNIGIGLDTRPWSFVVVPDFV